MGFSGGSGGSGGFEPRVDLGAMWQRRSYKWRHFPPDVLPTFVAEMDFALADPVKRALREAVERDDCGYAYPTGVGAAFARFAAAEHGWDVDPERVFLCADVMAGVDAVLWLATDPGAGVVVNPPVYPPFFEHIRDGGRRVVEVPLRGSVADGWALDFAGLEAAFAAGAAAFLLCNPHNPTGLVLGEADLRRVAELAERYGVIVLADEIHAPLTLPGATHTAYAGLGDATAAQAVTLTSASKAFNLPGLKAAVVVAGSEAMRTRLAVLPEWMTFRTGLLGVIASIAAWDDGREWLAGLRSHLDAQRTLLAELLAKHLPDIRYRPPEGTYLAWLDCTALGLGDDPREVFLERGRVALGRGLDFGAQGAGHVRLTMATSAEVLKELVERMAASV